MFPILFGIAMAAVPPLRTACAPYVVRQSPAELRADAAMIGARSGVRTLADGVHLVMGAPGWRLIWATPTDSEEGIWFYRVTGDGTRWVDTWGGVAQPNERDDVTRWATGLGVPAPLARCFARIGIDHEAMR